MTNLFISYSSADARSVHRLVDVRLLQRIWIDQDVPAAERVQRFVQLLIERSDKAQRALLERCRVLREEEDRLDQELAKAFERGDLLRDELSDLPEAHPQAHGLVHAELMAAMKKQRLLLQEKSRIGGDIEGVLLEMGQLRQSRQKVDQLLAQMSEIEREALQRIIRSI